MSAAPILQELARLVVGEPRQSLHRLLMLTCEQLGMDMAFVAVLDESGNRTIRQSALAGGTPGPEGLCEPLSETWCGRVAADGEFFTPDARDDSTLMALPSTRTFDIVSYAGVLLRDEDGTAFGTLCALGHAPHTSLNPRDREVLLGLAEVVAPLVRGLDGPAPLLSSAAPAGLAALAAAVEGVQGVERLSRALLVALGELTGMTSTYLSVVHEDEGVQEIRYTHNARSGFGLPEGLLVPWADTLCKRALDEGRACTTDVSDVWGDTDAARALGIRAHVSVPVRLPQGQLWGTLCAVDPEAADAAVAAHLPTMGLFARLVAAEVEREEAIKRARQDADTDPLTGCSSRRVVQPWLAVQLAELSPDDVLVAAYVDLDDLKLVNDAFGQAAGDAVLTEVGLRLRAAARPHDLVARLGGDEFLVVARVPRHATDLLADRVRRAVAFSMPWGNTFVEVRASVGIALSDGHNGPSLVAAADGAMYVVKHAVVCLP